MHITAASQSSNFLPDKFLLIFFSTLLTFFCLQNKLHIHVWVFGDW